jgi:hypothetical protein
MMIADQAKMTVLREHGSLVINRAIFEAVDQARSQLFAVRDLNKIGSC